MRSDQQLGVPGVRDSSGPFAVLDTPNLRPILSPVLVVVLVSGGFAVWVGFHLGGVLATRYFDDIVTALAAFTATAMCVRAQHGSVGRNRLFWALLGSACGAWTAAETTWAVYELILREPVPVPSWADVGYLGAIPLAAAALLCHPAIRARQKDRVGAALDGLMVACALLYLSWSLVLGPLWRSSDLSTAGGVVAVAYPFGDAVMLFLVIYAVRALAPHNRLALSCVLLGLLAMALSDSTYTYLVEGNRYTSGSLVDTGWVLSYLGLALGAFFSRSPASIRPQVAHDEYRSLLNSLVTPYLAILTALVAISIEVEVGHRQDEVDWFVALALVMLVIVRHVLVLVIRLDPGGKGSTHPTIDGTPPPSLPDSVRPATLRR